jgi:hypothetical protein
LRYLIGRIKARNLSAFVGYLDFKSAFDSPDVAVMIRWLELTGFQGCEILRHLYDGVQLVIDTAVGPTAPISKSRGTAQGDGLSPILFDLVIAVLLRRLAAANLGLKVDETRIGSLFFADDAAVVTTSLGQMQTALDITSKFEDDSGMRLNVPKTVQVAADQAGVGVFCRDVAVEEDGVADRAEGLVLAQDPRLLAEGAVGGEEVRGVERGGSEVVGQGQRLIVHRPTAQGIGISQRRCQHAVAAAGD